MPTEGYIAIGLAVLIIVGGWLDYRRLIRREGLRRSSKGPVS